MPGARLPAYGGGGLLVEDYLKAEIRIKESQFSARNRRFLALPA